MIHPLRYPGVGSDSSQSNGSCEASFFERVFRARGSDMSERRPSSTITSTPDDEVRLLGDGTVQASVATTLPELLEAAELVRERYEWRGYVTRSIKADAVDREHEASTLVARQRGLIVGTMTLGFDGPAGLWIDHTYPEEIARARARGRVLCELTRLAVTPNSDSRKILSSMFGLAYQVGRLQHGTTDLYIEVNPRHAPVYRKLLGFKVASDVRVCGRVRAPAVLLHLDIEQLDECVAQFASSAIPDLATRPTPRPAAVLPIDDTALRAA